MSPAYALRQVFGTRRGLRTFAANFFAAIGLFSAVAQFLGLMFFNPSFPAPVRVTVAAALGCLAWGIVRAYPRATIVREFTNPETVIRIEVGDLFTQDTHLVAGFTDTFDTSIVDERIISSTSVQGQLVHLRYGGDHRRLDKELAQSLRRTPPSGTERAGDKPGKRTRYPIGTVAVLGDAGRLVFAVAYSRMGNDLVPRSSVSDIWTSLDRLWAAVYERAERRPVSMPVIGSGLARIDELDREALLKLVLISFMARSRETPICHELRVLIHPADLGTVSLLEIDAFLRAL
jgi:hypothetical protein